MYNHPMNNTNNINNLNNHGDEIDLRKLFRVIWDGKKLVIAVTTGFAITALVISLVLPNIYQSKALLSAVDSQGGSGSTSQGIGGVARLAGINLSSSSAGNVDKALEKIKTLSFFEDNILPNIFLPDLMAIKRWDASTNTISYDKNAYNEKTKTWGSGTKDSSSIGPSSQKSYLKFHSQLNVSDNVNGFVTISVKHQSPHIAKAWAELVVDQINLFFRAKDKLEAQAAMDFLNVQMAQTSYSEINEVIAQLIQKKMEQLTLIEASEFYVFSYLDPPKVMEKKVEPNRSSICILGTILGALLGILIVITREFFKVKNN